MLHLVVPPRSSAVLALTAMSDSVDYRVAGPADADSLVSLASAFRQYLQQEEPSDAVLRQNFPRVLADPNAQFVLAEESGVALGYVQLRYRQSVWVGGWEAELEDVFVVDAARGRGVGRQLLEFALDRARQRGCVAVGLNTNERNAGAVTFYECHGFKAGRARWDGGRQIWFVRSL